jgi:arylsulfatase A-like enzyme
MLASPRIGASAGSCLHADSIDAFSENSMLADSRRSQPFAMLFLLLFMVAGIEMSNTLRQGIGRGMWDALNAGLLVFSLFGFICLLAGLIPLRGVARRAALFGLYVPFATLGVVLFLSWLAFWITGRPVNADAMSILLDSPLAAFLHLLSSDPLMVAALLAGATALLFAVAWLMNYALRSAEVVPGSTRLLICMLLGLLSVFAGYRIATNENSRSSYAALLGSANDPVRPVLSYSCPRSPAVPIVSPAVGTRSNGTPVIVIMIESLRADLLHAKPAAIPNIAKLAGESMVFDSAYATASHSDFADLAFWYSRYPLRAERRLGYPPDAAWRGLSVFEYFKLHDYSTAYFSSQNEKWGNMINWLKIPAIDTYFDSENFAGETWENHDDSAGLVALIRAGYARAGKVEDSKTLGLAAEWIEKHASEPFFIGLNLQNTHYHYFIPEGGARPFKPDEFGFRAVYSAWPADQAPVVRNRYMNAAYNVDAAVQQFRERLERAGVWDKAVVLVVGDSGEAFYEHGFGNHSGPMFEEVAKTLALLKLPKGDPRNGTKWKQPISHVDFVPALVELSGMQDWAGFQGTVPWKQPTGHPVYMTVNALSRENSVLRWPWKLMVRQLPDRSLALFNLESDPLETRNAIEHQPVVALEMLKDLNSWKACQMGYYADAEAHLHLQPPRYQWTGSAPPDTASMSAAR